MRRFFVGEHYVTDVIYDTSLGISESPQYALLDKGLPHQSLDDYDGFVDLLAPTFKKGKCVMKKISIHDIRLEAMENIRDFYQTPLQKPYAVGLEKKLFDVKQILVEQK